MLLCLMLSNPAACHTGTCPPPLPAPTQPASSHPHHHLPAQLCTSTLYPSALYDSLLHTSAPFPFYNAASLSLNSHCCFCCKRHLRPKRCCRLRTVNNRSPVRQNRKCVPKLISPTVCRDPALPQLVLSSFCLPTPPPCGWHHVLPSQTAPQHTSGRVCFLPFVVNMPARLQSHPTCGSSGRQCSAAQLSGRRGPPASASPPPHTCCPRGMPAYSIHQVGVHTAARDPGLGAEEERVQGGGERWACNAPS